jgi:hypothetical protein
MSRAVLFLAILIVFLPSGSAQQLGRPQDGFYSGQWSGQYSGQWSGQVDQRVDGRPNRREGLPPSAADKSNDRFDNPINAYDCVEVEALKPDARPGYQARVRQACAEW